MNTKKKLLILSQYYPPDPASVGQHLSDVAENMVKKNWAVEVYTPNRGYDNFNIKYKSYEVINGVSIRRMSLTSFGKSNIFLRAIGQVSLLIKSFLRIIISKKPDAILVSTNLVFILAPIFRIIYRVPYVYWVMDLNPDQAINAGALKSSSLIAEIYNKFQSFALKHAEVVISLDRFMSKLVTKKYKHIRKHEIMPPWPHESQLSSKMKSKTEFIIENGWEGKRVLMYSGNHSLVHPLTTFLEASKEFAGDNKIVFAFIGGGLGKIEVEDFINMNPSVPLISLPYQPIENLNSSLDSANIHMVSMGNNMVGCVHPCKVYGAMAIAKPILHLGSENDHIADLIRKFDIGWSIKHGDIKSMINTLNYLRDVENELLLEKGINAKKVITDYYSQDILMNKFCNYIEECC